ncbi:hypothetical protein PSACC_00386 [Paramicrosporidium saccamoebae]|uniref:Uncharacterized protein n=1 Tax=Paramicrosporidium saccamoebae TaxID=1246581 RepID=A0A2H9TPT1_9FUNG|nr:hypothetical protein PSACC_00386 [Paramicrosporidium saccamoebae]
MPAPKDWCVGCTNKVCTYQTNRTACWMDVLLIASIAVLCITCIGIAALGVASYVCAPAARKTCAAKQVGAPPVIVSINQEDELHMAPISRSQPVTPHVSLGGSTTITSSPKSIPSDWFNRSDGPTFSDIMKEESVGE